LAKFMVKADGTISADVVGMNADRIAEGAGIDVPTGTKILLVELEGLGPEEPFSREKLCPVLGYTTVESDAEGFDVAEKLLRFGGLG
ncbi:hypothetical protein, partial [Actinotignum timonense]|nr:hypothetical protein [Actinotignum timonense]